MKLKGSLSTIVLLSNVPSVLHKCITWDLKGAFQAVGPTI